MRWAEHVTRVEERMRRSERNIPLRHRLLHNIKLDRRELGWGGMDWIDVARDRLG
jgi:hypothetical protein